MKNFEDFGTKKRQVKCQEHIKDLSKDLQISEPTETGQDNTAERFNQSFFGSIDSLGSEDEDGSNSQVNKYQQMMNQKRYLTYIKQIKYTLKSVLKKKQLLSIKEKMEQGLKDYYHKTYKIKIEANLPRKNHVQIDENFRGSLYRRESKNRKKW